jgi:thiosulfate reductase cytochrome b subunit
MPVYIQQDATLHGVFYLETALHVLGGTSAHNQECIQLYLQHLVFVTPLTATGRYRGRIVPCNGVTNTRCRRYSCMHS